MQLDSTHRLCVEFSQGLLPGREVLIAIAIACATQWHFEQRKI